MRQASSSASAVVARSRWWSLQRRPVRAPALRKQWNSILLRVQIADPVGGLLDLGAAQPNTNEDHAPVTGDSLHKPIAVLENGIYNFGTMEPFERRRHSFVIRNDGDAPLELREGESSCKCTIGEVGDGTVAPGETTTVMLSWRSGEGNKRFAHEAEVLTNDPNNPVLRCVVEGQIVSQLLADPGEFGLAGMFPGVAETSSVTLSTQVWDSFRVFDIGCTLETVTWDLQPLSDTEKQSMDVKDGYRLTITMPDNLERGYFSHTLKMQVQPEGEGAKVYELPIKGNVLRRVSIYGKGIDSTGKVKLGKVRRGVGIKKYFSVKVRDPDPSLEVKKIETRPDFMKVSFVDNEKVQSPGLYRMLLDIPADAPRASFMGEPVGKVHIEFQNPSFENIDLDVEFAILGEGDF